MEANHAAKKIILPEGSSKLAKFEHMQRRGETAETVNSPLRDEYAEYLDSKGRYDYESQEPPEGLPDSPPVIPDELLLQNQGNPVVQNEQREEALVEDNQQAPVQAENPIDEGVASEQIIEAELIPHEPVGVNQGSVEIELEELSDEDIPDLGLPPDLPPLHFSQEQMEAVRNSPRDMPPDLPQDHLTNEQMEAILNSPRDMPPDLPQDHLTKEQLEEIRNNNLPTQESIQKQINEQNKEKSLNE